MDTFVDIEWLADRLGDVVIADVRWYLDGRSGRAAYEAGHIPGAVFVELEEVLSAPASDADGRHPLPAPERFAAGLSELGIGDADTVIAYDDGGGVIAARLVWMLRVTGHAAALLDGGLSAWSGGLERGPAPQRPMTTFTAAPWPPERLASIDEVAAVAAGASGPLLIDARDYGRFAGGPDSLDPRSGHIPGAVSVPTREHLDPHGRIASSSELRERFAAAGIGQDSTVISYCGSGITACHNLLVMNHAGLGPGRLYPGSWSQWSRDPSRPIEMGNAV
jgi:thiosulfate/3-mercaptopyruvate sulfurtransferase